MANGRSRRFRHRTMLTFATLGPAGSNHEFVTERYLALHGLEGAKVLLIDDFDDALQKLADGDVDFVIQVAVHPAATDTVAQAHFEYGIRVIDTFISPSRPLGVLTRADIANPRSLGLQPATKAYLDTARWETLIPEASIQTVAEGLLTGRFDSGVTALSFAEAHPGKFRIEEELGTVDDPWLVYGRARVSDGGVVAWPDSPAASLYRTALSR